MDKLNIDELTKSMTHTVDKVLCSVKTAMDPASGLAGGPEQKILLELIDDIIAHNKASAKELDVLKKAIVAKLKDKQGGAVTTKKKKSEK